MTKRVIPNKTPGTGYVQLEPGPPRSYAAMLRIDPADNVLVGGETILRYLGVSSMNTLHRWVELYAFPAIKRPDGLWMSSMTAIDQWIFLAAEIMNENLDQPRGLNVGADLALERLQRQVGDPDRFAQSRRASALRAARGVGLLPGRKEPERPYKSAWRDRAHGGARDQYDHLDQNGPIDEVKASNDSSDHAE